MTIIVIENLIRKKLNHMLKSTQTNKYETACFVQEAPINSGLERKGLTIKTSCEGLPYCIFKSPLWSFGHYNRMHRRYDKENARSVIQNDERLNNLKAKRQWRGEWNHPNPEIKGQQFSDIRMTIPEPRKTSHFITDDEFVGDLYKATITTHPRTEDGRAVASEIIDIGAQPSFSVRLMGTMIPNAPMNAPNMRVSKVITFDMVDFPSHQEANADIDPVQESTVIFLKELAKYCCEQDENMAVVCESFEISPSEIITISNDASIICEQADTSKIIIPLKSDIRREALSILRGIR
jgi:hypothetical protein